MCNYLETWWRTHLLPLFKEHLKPSQSPLIRSSANRNLRILSLSLDFLTVPSDNLLRSRAVCFLLTREDNLKSVAIIRHTSIANYWIIECSNGIESWEEV